MKMLQWFKQSTCPCTQHVISRGGNQWQLRPLTTVPPEVVLKLPTLSNSIILKKRAAKKIVTDQASLADEASSIQSDGTSFEAEAATSSDTADTVFNQKMKKMFQNPVLQNEQTLNELCSKILKNAKQANPLKWLIHVNSASKEVDELLYWKEQMKQDIDCMVTHIQTKLYTGLDELYGEMYNLFMEED